MKIWNKKNRPLLAGLLGGAVLLIVAISMIASHYSKGKRSAGVDPSPSESAGPTDVVALPEGAPVEAEPADKAEAAQQFWKSLCDKDMDEASEQILSQPFDSETIEVENIHFIDESGQETRIHIIPSEGDTGSQLQVKFFKLDGDGLPQMIQTPRKYRGMNVEQLEKAVLSQVVIRSSKKAKRVYADGQQATLEILNDELKRALFVSAQVEVLCRGIKGCDCKTN